MADASQNSELVTILDAVRSGLLAAAALPPGLRLVNLAVKAGNANAPVVLEAEFSSDDGEPPKRFVSADLLALVAASEELGSTYLAMLAWLHGNAR